MRKILFKAKCLSDGKWYHGFYYETPNGISYIRNDKYTVQVDPETVCQFTGLRDKNGVKIFEWDILDFGVLNVKTTIVTFEKGCFMHSTNVLYIGCDAMEVIGNIHDK